DFFLLLICYYKRMTQFLSSLSRFSISVCLPAGSRGNGTDGCRRERPSFSPAGKSILRGLIRISSPGRRAIRSPTPPRSPAAWDTAPLGSRREIAEKEAQRRVF